MKIWLAILLALLLGCKAYDFKYADDEEEGGLPNCDKLTTLMPICINRATNIELVLIPAGSFVMGANGGEQNENPAHNVTISKPFYIGVFEVTQNQWSAVMGGNRSTAPVSGVSWAKIADANGFVAKLNANAGAITIGGVLYEYALPSEAQWEYAARGGTNAPYFWGDGGAVGEYAWYSLNSSGAAHTVGAKKSNGFLLFDISGNVAEWTQDCYDEYSAQAVSDPIFGCSVADRVVRGGSYEASLDDLRVSKRERYAKSYSSATIGFRLALVPKRP
ncbi:MAG: formylglycine-generating enzyme family protein [Helicobacteraceae bacterium]|jgi:formylglycine-generating enzyme required for sulfatase activity|nr:formylglycine-generating enzyme family protein [Helicobacteraceae bacterium]